MDKATNEFVANHGIEIPDKVPSEAEVEKIVSEHRDLLRKEYAAGPENSVVSKMTGVSANDWLFDAETDDANIVKRAWGATRVNLLDYCAHYGFTPAQAVEKLLAKTLAVNPSRKTFGPFMPKGKRDEVVSKLAAAAAAARLAKEGLEPENFSDITDHGDDIQPFSGSFPVVEAAFAAAENDIDTLLGEDDKVEVVDLDEVAPIADTAVPEPEPFEQPEDGAEAEPDPEAELEVSVESFPPAVPKAPEPPTAPTKPLSFTDAFPVIEDEAEKMIEEVEEAKDGFAVLEGDDKDDDQDGDDGIGGGDIPDVKDEADYEKPEKEDDSSNKKGKKKNSKRKFSLFLPQI